MASKEIEESAMDDLLKDLFEEEDNDGLEEEDSLEERNNGLFSMLGMSEEQIVKAQESLLAEEVEEEEETNSVRVESKEVIISIEEQAEPEQIEEPMPKETEEDLTYTNVEDKDETEEPGLESENNEDVIEMTEDEALADMLAGGFSEAEEEDEEEDLGPTTGPMADLLQGMPLPTKESMDIEEAAMIEPDLEPTIEQKPHKKSKEEKKKEKEALKEAKRQAKINQDSKEHSKLYYTLFGPDETEEELAPTEEELEKARLKAEAKAKKKEDNAAKKEQKEEANQQKKVMKSGQLELKKADKRHRKDQLLKENEEEDAKEHKISKPIVIITCIILLLAALISNFGGSLFSYTLSINRATAYFEKQRYKLAYEQIVGVDVKDKDKKIESQITTVMYVQKQLDSYLNFMKMDKKDSALDALIKGVARYDEHIKEATELGIEGDLVGVEGQIETYLQQAFSLSADNAREIYQLDDDLYNMRIKELVKQTSISEETVTQ